VKGCSGITAGETPDLRIILRPGIDNRRKHVRLGERAPRTMLVQSAELEMGLRTKGLTGVPIHVLQSDMRHTVFIRDVTSLRIH
jgi:hypothetical protein